ncbi:MAG TPA: formate dehydrogenase subunit delta [Methylophilaceae bacterium]|nr:formate dehydrogenase subunit delta [Methylophilaceae bacterium]HQR59868.1 formate dehydrogenase subunit delta [Methylophilaceae bacterium]
MDIHHLVKMANQIGQFFESEPDQQQAVQDIATHIKRFWDPRMRKTLIGHIENGGAGLLPIVMKSLQENQESLV